MNFAKGLGTSIGTKFLMGVTGLLLLGFVIAHLVGNLQLYAGPQKINDYAEMLKNLGPLLWVARIGLLVVLLIHVRSAVVLTQRSRAARPIGYAVSRPIQSTYASRTMLMSGLIVLAFVVYHLLHFTLGFVEPAAYALKDAQGRHDVYSMVVVGFQNPVIALSYIAAMALLGLHLSHGVASLCQSLGWVRPKYREMIRKASLGLTAAIVLGNISMPLSCLLRIVDLPGATS